LLQHTNGLLYGETCCGGSFGVGVFYSLNAGLRPFASFVPAIGHDGQTIDILGQGFTGTTRVSFHGKPAKFRVVSDTFLTATVPEHATSGFVAVTTPRGKLTSNKQFQVSSQEDDFKKRDEDGDRDHDGRHDDRRHMSLCEEHNHE
ncbi:MAG: IPT/TIG domain-containing protein, partial [Candidatus Angelobacter sp.]